MKRLYLTLLMWGVLGACTQPAQTIVPALSQSQQLELACEDGHGSACFDLGVRFLSNDAVSTRRAERAFESGCDLNFGPACLKLGELSERHAETPFGDTGHRERRVLIYYERACHFGEQEGCQKLGRALFFKAHTLSEQAKGLRRLDQLCDDGHYGGCIDILKARLAQGGVPSSLVVSRLNVHCRTQKENSSRMTTFCARLRLELCREDPSAAECTSERLHTRASIVEEPSCPAQDLPWLLSVIHTNVQSCAQSLPSQLRFTFDRQGQISLSGTKTLNGTCLGRRIQAMKILPLTTEDGCTLNVRF